jgi:ribosomal protein S18 acetylase RimI-like enzyme
VTPTDRTDDEAPSEVTVRRAVAEDGPAIASLYTAARAHAIPQMPTPMHTPEEDLTFFSRRITDDEVTAWIAEANGEILGFALCTPTFLDGLYVRPDLKGQGLGSLLLDVVEATHPDGYELWVFESNVGARRLYQRRGLVEVERTDGAGNEDKAPDVRMAWRP